MKRDAANQYLPTCQVLELESRRPQTRHCRFVKRAWMMAVRDLNMALGDEMRLTFANCKAWLAR